MTEEMYTHENKSTDYRMGYRDGLDKALDLVKDYIDDLKADHKVHAMMWVAVVRDWIDDELSMYVVGGEE